MISGAAIAQRGKDQLVRLTGLQAATVSGLSKKEQGWQVSVDMIEMKRIPDSMDVLATYRALLDEEGNVATYERVRRFYRNQVTEEEA